MGLLTTLGFTSAGSAVGVSAGSGITTVGSKTVGNEFVCVASAVGSTGGVTDLDCASGGFTAVELANGSFTSVGFISVGFSRTDLRRSVRRPPA